MLSSLKSLKFCCFEPPSCKIIEEGEDSAEMVDSDTQLSLREKDCKSLIPDLEIGRFLGKGACSQVFEAVNKYTQETFAIKCTKTSKGKKHLYNEHRFLKLCNHPNIIKVHEFVTHNFHCHLVLDLAKEDLFDRVETKSLSERQIRVYFRQVVSGVQHLHEQNIAHRDLKLGNILLTEQDQIKIADFGYADKLEDMNKMKHKGSWYYTSPEILEKSELDLGVDHWALGIMLYVLVYKEYPFDKFGALREELVFPNEGEISANLEELITRLLDKNPKTRLGSHLCCAAILNHPWMQELASSENAA